LKQGRTGEAKAAFARYLAMKPDAPDAAWVRQMAG
jgi:predicted RNA polymerase sigma factor